VNDILRWAKEADLWMTSDERIAAVERFAALVAAAAKEEMLMAGNDQWLEEARKAEREACAKVCDEMEQRAEGTECCKWPTPSDCAAAIRARGNT
jgi:hypothetical protein